MRRSRGRPRGYRRKNPLSTQQWLFVGLGTVVVGGIVYAIYTAYQDSVWPPSADVQNGILNQILTANSTMGGQAPTPAQAQQLAASVAQLPGLYASSLPAGTAPTVPGYQAYVSGQVNNYVTSGGAPGGYSSTVTDAQLGVPGTTS